MSARRRGARRPEGIARAAAAAAVAVAAAAAVIAAAPPAAQAAISGETATNDATSVFYSFQLTGSPPWRRVYIDTDRNPATGYAQGGVGANYMLENGVLYRHLGGGWSWQLLKTVTFSVVAGTARWTVARADIGETATPNDTDLVFQTESPLTTSGKLTHTFSGGPPGPAPVATNDAASVYYELAYTGSPLYQRVYIDTDRNPATGFSQGGVGANYMLEGGGLYRHLGGGWSWQLLKSVPFTSAANVARWTVARADIGETAAPNDADLVFQTEAPLVTLPKQTHVYSGTRTFTYAASDASFANPERGLYHHAPFGDCDKDDFDVSLLQGFRTVEGVTLVMCMFYLEGFQAAPLSQAVIDKLNRQTAAVRAAGLKMILRFAYTRSLAGDDAPLPRILGHLDQLAPFVAANSDVIHIMPAGFVGAFGEGYFTQNFGNLGVISPADWTNRKAVVDRVLAVLPLGRMTQLRTPLHKRTMYGPNPLPPAQAFSAAHAARIGLHNDCFLADVTDFGTYADPATEYPFLAADSAFVPTGGESCNPNPPRSLCPTALAELELFHWSYMNIDYRVPVLESWDDGGCLPEIVDRLGYRFSLQSGTFPEAAHPGAALPVTLAIRNDGWAAPVNPRPVELVLRNTATGATQRLPLVADARRWPPGVTVTVAAAAALPASLPAGSYALSLALPDPAPALSGRAEYAIRLANQNVWSPAAGTNDLLHTVAVR